jgi:hypothetical protein
LRTRTSTPLTLCNCAASSLPASSPMRLNILSYASGRSSHLIIEGRPHNKAAWNVLVNLLISAVTRQQHVSLRIQNWNRTCCQSYMTYITEIDCLLTTEPAGSIVSWSQYDWPSICPIREVKSPRDESRNYHRYLILESWYCTRFCDSYMPEKKVVENENRPLFYP